MWLIASLTFPWFHWWNKMCTDSCISEVYCYLFLAKHLVLRLISFTLNRSLPWDFNLSSGIKFNWLQLSLQGNPEKYDSLSCLKKQNNWSPFTATQAFRQLPCFGASNATYFAASIFCFASCCLDAWACGSRKMAWNIFHPKVYLAFISCVLSCIYFPSKDQVAIVLSCNLQNL